MLLCKLDGSIRMIMMQFSFSNPDNVPFSLRTKKRESAEESQVRQTRKVTSRQPELIAPPYPQLTSLEHLPMQIVGAGWDMVSAFDQRRLHPVRANNYYYTVRFTFVPSRYKASEPDQERFQRFMPIAFAELQGLAQLALWRARMFKNQFFVEYVPVPGQYAISINFEARQPLFEQNSPPITAQHRLWLNNNGLMLTYGFPEAPPTPNILQRPPKTSGPFKM